MRPFKRGPGPLVSILFPTRGRPEGLLKALDSLWSLARDKSLIEFIYWADDDDFSTVSILRRLQETPGFPIRGFVCPRGRGYHDMHHWVNAMAQKARGDWLIIWNDDAVMKTQDWDQALARISPDAFNWHGVEDVMCLVARTIGSDATGFFFLRRTVVEILGQFSRIPHNDTWVTSLMRAVDSLYHLDWIEVEHLSESKDATWNEGIEARSTTEYTVHNPGLRVIKMEDALKLAEYIERVSHESPR